MNLNRIKKIAVKFPNFIDVNMIYEDATRNVTKFKQARNVNLEMMAQKFAGDSGMQIGYRNLPHIEGFNCTFLNDLYFPAHFAMQFTFASGEERKVMRLIEKYNGILLPIRQDSHQFGTQETDNTTRGKEYSFDRTNEEIE